MKFKKKKVSAAAFFGGVCFSFHVAGVPPERDANNS